jgi:hypothetical protein
LLKAGAQGDMLMILGTLTGPTHRPGEKISIYPLKTVRWLVKGHAYVVDGFDEQE